MPWPKSVGPEDLEVVFSRGSGPGGQKRNKTSSKCQITHVPTGISAVSDETRSAEKNKRIAFRKLANLLIPMMVGPSGKERDAAGTKVVRTYTKREDRVVDYRLRGRYSYDGVLHGDKLNELIEDIILHGTPT